MKPAASIHPTDEFALRRLDHRVDTLAERAYQQLRSRLVMGQFVPGDHITIRAVAKSLGVSFTPVRDALSRLVAEGALESRPRYYDVPILNVEQAREIYDVRLLLEARLVETALLSATPGAIAELEKLQAQLVGARRRKNARERLEVNYEFHFKLYRLAKM